MKAGKRPRLRLDATLYENFTAQSWGGTVGAAVAVPAPIFRFTTFNRAVCWAMMPKRISSPYAPGATDVRICGNGGDVEAANRTYSTRASFLHASSLHACKRLAFSSIL